ncbi:hypothetical protein IAT38_006678 [Cryptococcus sp. DSM 104549]
MSADRPSRSTTASSKAVRQINPHLHNTLFTLRNLNTTHPGGRRHPPAREAAAVGRETTSSSSSFIPLPSDLRTPTDPSNEKPRAERHEQGDQQP